MFGANRSHLVNQRWLDEESAGSFVDYTRAPKLGYFGGLSLNHPVADSIDLRIEVMYARRQAAVDIVWLFGNFERESVKIDLTYIDVPLLARIRLDIAPAIAPFLTIGATGSYLIKATETEAADEETITKGLKRLDVGATIGAGVLLESFAVEARYTHGLFEIDKDYLLGEVSNAARMRNRSFSVMAHVFFR